MRNYSGGNYSGYKFDPNAVFAQQGVKRWGTNLTSPFSGGSLTAIVPNPGNSSLTSVFASTFDAPGMNQTSSEAIGVSGDSGGGVFSSCAVPAAQIDPLFCARTLATLPAWARLSA